MNFPDRKFLLVLVLDSGMTVVFNGRDAALRRPDSAARCPCLQIDTLPKFPLSTSLAGRNVQTMKVDSRHPKMDRLNNKPLII